MRSNVAVMELEKQLRQKDELIAKLKGALSCTRGQWIHSVNAPQCLEALSSSEAKE